MYCQSRTRATLILARTARVNTVTACTRARVPRDTRDTTVIQVQYHNTTQHDKGFTLFCEEQMNER